MLKCVLCDSSNIRLMLTGYDKLLNLPGEFRVMQCQECKLLFTDPASIKMDINKYYPDSYCPYKSTDDTQNSKKKNMLKCQDNLKDKINNSFFISFLKEIFGDKGVIIPKFPPGSNVLDIGCASGNFLYSLRNKKWNLYGIELSKFAAEEAKKRGLNVFQGTLTQAEFKNNFFNLIFANQVLEHLPNPVEAVKEIKRILDTNGLLIFSVPNAESWEFKFFKDTWYGLDVPRHFFHFGPTTIKKLLNSSGMNLVHIYYQRNLNNLYGSLAFCLEKSFGKNFFSQWLRTLPNHSNLILRILLFPLAAFFSIIKQSGRITVIASPMNKLQ